MRLFKQYLLFCVVIVIIGGVFSHFFQNAAAEKPQSNSSEKTNASDGRRFISLGIYNELTPGLITYSQLSKLIGPGTSEAQTISDGIDTEAYRWSNPDGSNMGLMFQNGRLVSKSQFGLRP